MLSKNQIKEIQSLQIKKFRDARHLFLAEGIKTVSEIMLSQPALIQEIFATHDFILNNQASLASLNLRHTEITEGELERISLQQAPNQVLAVCHYFPERAADFDFEQNFSLYLDDVRDPGNFGTMIRLADWFGISTVFCSPASCDLYNPKVIQASMGAFLRVNVVYTELDVLKKTQHIPAVYGALLNGKDLYKETLRNGLIIIGNEANGIRENNLPHINYPLTIPAHRSNGTESLNAAVAASIIVSEFFRQLRR
jgi:TrmH family RNA methyltransferase